MAEIPLHWKPWSNTEKDLFGALALLPTAPAGPKDLIGAADKLGKSLPGEDHTGRVARDIMGREGIAARKSLTPRQRYEELWRLAVAFRGVPPPPQVDATWIMNLTSEETVRRQLQAEGAKWVIDQCINLHTIFEFEGVGAENVETFIGDRFLLSPALSNIKESKRIPGHVYWDKLCLRNFRPAESDTIVTEGMPLFFERIDWLDVEVFSLGLRGLLEDKVYQGRLLQLDESAIPAIACMHVVLVTADGKVVLARRSRHKNFHPLTWSFSFEEQLNATPRRRSNKPDRDPFDAIVEGAWEEFHVDVGRETIRLVSVSVELPNYAADIIAIARCAETATQLWACWQQATDHSEHDSILTLEPELESLGPHFFRPAFASDFDAVPLWHPTSRMRLLAFLAHRWGLGQTLAYLSNIRESGVNLK